MCVYIHIYICIFGAFWVQTFRLEISYKIFRPNGRSSVVFFCRVDLSALISFSPILLCVCLIFPVLLCFCCNRQKCTRHNGVMVYRGEMLCLREACLSLSGSGVCGSVIVVRRLCRSLCVGVTLVGRDGCRRVRSPPSCSWFEFLCRSPLWISKKNWFSKRTIMNCHRKKNKKFVNALHKSGFLFWI